MLEKFKKLACKWGIHSFKVEVTYLEYPPFYQSKCLWCGDPDTKAFGNPPASILQTHETMMQARSEAYKKMEDKRIIDPNALPQKTKSGEQLTEEDTKAS